MISANESPHLPTRKFCCLLSMCTVPTPRTEGHLQTGRLLKIPLHKLMYKNINEASRSLKPGRSSQPSGGAVSPLRLSESEGAILAQFDLLLRTRICTVSLYLNASRNGKITLSRRWPILFLVSWNLPFPIIFLKSLVGHLPSSVV